MDDYPTTGSASVTLTATPAEVYAHLTDLDKLPQLSPENMRCEYLDDATTSIAVGTRFRGHNKAGDYEWHADCVVIEADPGRAFAFEVPPGYEHATTWRYDIEASDGGTIVTESFDAPLLALPDVYPGKIEGRCAQLQRACEQTLANLKSALEASSAS